ncbi:MAG: hypothetical protein QXJ75_01115, partial [Candidatus Bathyarchaeia archaeon]
VNSTKKIDGALTVKSICSASINIDGGGLLGKVKLYMGPPTKGDSGIARLSTKAIAELKAKEGDMVEIRQGIFSMGGLLPTFRIAKALPEDEGKNIVRVGEEDFKKSKFKVDQKATVSTL